MRAHQIMSRNVVTVTPQTKIVDAANSMLMHRISGVPVLGSDGRLVGIVSESDFMRRVEIGTERKRGRWLKLLLGPGEAASEYVRARGRKVAEVMTPDPITATEDMTLEEVVQLMETKNVKRLPVVHDNRLVGIVSRANIVHAVADLARDIPDPTADDDHIRNRIITAIEKQDWTPFGLNVTVRDGVVQLNGVITAQASRAASIVAAENVEGVITVHDHLCWVEPMSGMYLDSEEDERIARAG